MAKYNNLRAPDTPNAKRCRECEKVFNARRTGNAFCSEKCFEASSERRKTTCRKCGEKFEKRAGNQLYCSKACQPQYEPRTRIHQKVCPQCGASFETKNIQKIYCDQRCVQRAGAKAKREKERMPEKPKIIEAPEYTQEDYHRWKFWTHMKELPRDERVKKLKGMRSTAMMDHGSSWLEYLCERHGVPASIWNVLDRLDAQHVVYEFFNTRARIASKLLKETYGL